MDLDRQRQLDLDAEAEAEAQFLFEQEQSTNRPPPFARQSQGIGPDYDSSVGYQAVKAIEDFPEAALNLGSDALDLATPDPGVFNEGNSGGGFWSDVGNQTLESMLGPASGIYGAMKRNPERGARTVGSFAAGTAGAGVMAPAGAAGGAAVGSLFGPAGTAVGGALGGVGGAALGFGGGLLGFDMGLDSLTGDNPEKTYNQYLKDLVYNSTQALPFMGAHAAVTKGIPAGYEAAKAPFSEARAEARVVNDLNNLEPGYAAKIDPALQAAQAAGNPLPEKYSLPELIGSDPLKSFQRVFTSSGTDNINAAKKFEAARNDTHLRYLNDIPAPTDPSLADAVSLADQSVQAEKAAAQGQTDQAIQNRTGQTTAEVAAAQQALGTKLSANEQQALDRLTTARAGQESAQSGVNDAILGLPEEIDPAVGGAQVRTQVRGNKRTESNNVSKLFEGAGNGLVPPSQAQAVLAAEMPKYFREVGPRPNEALSKAAADLTREGTVSESGLLDPTTGEPAITPPVYTIQDIQAIRSDLLKVKGDSRSVAVANKLTDALLMDLKAAVEAGTIGPGDAGRLEAGIAARKQVGVNYENVQTPARSILRRQAGNRQPVVPDAGVLPQYFLKDSNPKARGAVENYQTTVGSSPEAMEPLYRHAVDSFRRYAVRDGNLVDSAAAKRWLLDHSVALNKMPELKRMLSDVHRRQQFLNEKAAEVKLAEIATKKAEIENRKLQASTDQEIADITKQGEAEIRELQKQNTRTQKDIEESAAKYLLDDRDLSQVIPGMLSGKNAGLKTKATVKYLASKDPLAVKGLLRGIVDWLTADNFTPALRGGTTEALKTGEQFQGRVTPGNLANEVSRVLNIIEDTPGLATKSQVKSLEYLLNSQESINSVGRAKALSGQTGSSTPSDLTVLAEIGRMSGKEYLRGVLGQGKLGFLYRVIEPTLSRLPAGQYNKIMLEAILNPRYARDLQNRATAKNVSSTASQIFKTELGLERLPVANEDSKRQQKPFVRKAEKQLSNKLFPKAADLKSGKAPGELKKTSFNLTEMNPFEASTAEAEEMSTPRRQQQLSPETLARISVESNGNPDAVSPKGAQGLSQLMPATGRWIGEQLQEQYNPLTKNMTSEERQASIEQNIRFGDWYFQKLEQDFGNTTLARAAYNAGPGRVRAAMRAAGTSDVQAILRSLPKGVQAETLPYVDKISRRLGRT